MHLIAKVIRISRAKSHRNRLTAVQGIQDYASLIFGSHCRTWFDKFTAKIKGATKTCPQSIQILHSNLYILHSFKTPGKSLFGTFLRWTNSIRDPRNTTQTYHNHKIHIRQKFSAKPFDTYYTGLEHTAT